ncbi:hypothetical protein UM93_00875 [Psychromicrobium lacuslunae]|uniref:Acetyl-CoA carboxylase n=1 Tax=Psychromicrobium lacuslunae TaxID=1618207 RepID=A0A0D4C2J2_9MICC|nr:hypothetical protein UM93_00875 [Psychromicrobium lacuslunae]
MAPSLASQAQADEQADLPLLQVVKGQPNAEELAALTAVVLALSNENEEPDTNQPGSGRSWVRRSNLRLAPAPGPGAWKRSSWR